MLTRTNHAQFLLPLLLLALGGSTSAQQEKAQTEKPKPAAAQEASAPAAPAATMGIPLTGVTKDNTAKIHDALQKISHAGFHCPKCQAAAHHEGTCKMCNVALEKDAVAKPVAKSVQIDDKGVLKLSVDSGQRVRLSEIEQVAKANGAAVNRADYVVPAYARILVSGPANAEAAKKLEKALIDAKVFASVTVGVDEAAKGLYVMPGEGAVKLSVATAAIEKAGADFKYQDLVIAAPCGECAKKGMAQAACKACWEAPHHT